MKNLRFSLSLLLVALITIAAGQALAQSETEEGHSHGIDPTTTPLVVPAIEDYAPPPGGEVDNQGNPVEVAPVGVNGYFEFSEYNKIFNITPRYRFNKNWAAKVRVPWIAERTVNVFDEDVSASGLGDVTVEGEYTHLFETPGTLLRLQASLKLPTGDHENSEEYGGGELVVPLGSGSLDYMLRGQYTTSTATTGLLVSAMLRKNTEGERQYVYDDGFGYVETQTTTVTEGNQGFLAVFGRRSLNNGIWLNLGTSILITGDGSGEYNSVDNTGFEYGYTYDKTTKSTMVDLYPGISYDLGVITPYLGARIPLSTSFDADGMNEDRDTVFLFQISYRPLKLAD